MSLVSIDHCINSNTKGEQEISIFLRSSDVVFFKQKFFFFPPVNDTILYVKKSFDVKQKYLTKGIKNCKKLGKK